MVYEYGHFIPLVGAPLHLDKDLVERGRRSKRRRYHLNQSRTERLRGCACELLNNQIEA
jgi:hypothetical protein